MAQIGITSKETEPDLESNSKNEGFGKEWPKLELLSGSTRIALMEPNRFLNREEANRHGTDTTRTTVRFCFTFLKPNEPKRTARSLTTCVIENRRNVGKLY